MHRPPPRGAKASRQQNIALAALAALAALGVFTAVRQVDAYTRDSRRGALRARHAQLPARTAQPHQQQQQEPMLEDYEGEGDDDWHQGGRDPNADDYHPGPALRASGSSGSSSSSLSDSGAADRFASDDDFGDAGEGEGEGDDEDEWEDDDGAGTAAGDDDGGAVAGSDGARAFPGLCKRLSVPTVPDLRPQRVWRSARPRGPTDVTLVTQLSVDRLPALQLQCSVWGSAIAAAVYVPALDGAVLSPDPALNGSAPDAAQRRIRDMHAEAEATGRCKLDLVFVVEVITSLDQVGLYPVNALRNRALQLARTDVLLLLDADFIPNKDLADDVTDPDRYAHLHRATAARQAVVLPAFETVTEGVGEGRRAALRAAASKDVVRQMMAHGRLQAFHSDHFENGHRATQFDRWQDTSVAYKVQYEEGFEPYVMVARKFVPWYDERFKGYRKNKVVHLMHMEQAGTTFVATPRGWVVHVPHPTADTWQATQETGYWKKLKRLYASAREDMDADRFVPATAFPCERAKPEPWSWYRRRRRAAA